MSDENVFQFCNVTGASVQDAKKFINTYRRVDYAIDAWYNNLNRSGSAAPPASAPSPNKLKTLFDKYADSTGVIAADGTIRLCEDLGVEPEDPVLLALAYELKSGKLGEWDRQGWMDGWKTLGADSLQTMQPVITRLRSQLHSDISYFRSVYKQTFLMLIALQEGQRSLVLDLAKDYWSLLVGFGLKGGVISGGWKDEFTDWWLEFLTDKKKLKGVSKDTWNMFLDFICSVDSKFSNYDKDAAWPSVIDEFVDWAKARLDK